MKNDVLTSLKLTIAVVLILFTTYAYATDWKDYSAEWNVAPDPSATLLQTIKKEAAASEVYPPMFAFYSNSYDVSFTRYLPYYRLKAKTAQATEGEIDECVHEFDNLNTKEQAYVLTAIFIYERIHRRPMVTDEEWHAARKIIINGFGKEVESEVWVDPQQPHRLLLRTITSKYNISRTQLWREIKEFDWFPYRPLTSQPEDFEYWYKRIRYLSQGFKLNEQRMFLLPPSDFPPDNLNGTVSETVWEQRVNVIKKCAHSDEIAFPAFHPEETSEMTFYGGDENESKLIKKWLADLDICLQYIDDFLHLKISSKVFWRGSLDRLGKDVNVPYAIGEKVPYSVEEFLRRTDEKERTASSDSLGLAAIREYWILVKSTTDAWREPSGAGLPYGNSSSKPKTLGEIAQFLLEGRIQYDKPFFDEELLNRGVDGETGAK